MDVRALLIVPSSPRVAGSALATVDVLGASVLQRAVDQLTAQVGAHVTVIADSALKLSQIDGAKLVTCEAGEEWRTAERVFAEHNGEEFILLGLVNAYTGVNWRLLVDQHARTGARATRLFHHGEPLEYWVVSSNRRNEAAFLLRSRLQRSRSESAQFHCTDYCRLLRSGADIRELAIEGLYQHSDLRPKGREVRPGIWMGRGVRIEAGARLVAPVYIGEYSVIYTGAVVTRASAVEHHSTIDCGTVVENSTVLPLTFVGAGLEVVSMVVGAKKLCHLRRNVETEISDTKLLRSVSGNAGLRLAASAWSLLALLPQAAVAKLRLRNGQCTPVIPGVHAAIPVRPATAKPGSASLPAEVPQVVGGYMMARRYGEQ